ncbi:MAG: hypothetical protein M1835_003143 [Candelina submexicana]|nr:MAG: hypothetical protein M1835_003143 [Candelina submexicana]
MAPFLDGYNNGGSPLSGLANAMKSSTAETSPPHPPYLLHLAAQVQHNLEYQHDWTKLRLHTHSPLPSCALLSRPVLSGIPPQRIYIHPDEQVEMLKHGLTEADLEPAREWVLPTRLKEKWSLRNFAEIFDNIGEAPPVECEQHEPGIVDEIRGSSFIARKREKRLLLATVGDDSTIVYYIVHDGIVKPRQN